VCTGHELTWTAVKLSVWFMDAFWFDRQCHLINCDHCGIKK